MSISLTNGQQVPDSSIIFYTTVVIDDGLLMSTPINLVQYDTSLAVICFRILEGGSQYNPSNSAQINFRMKKPDGHGVYNPVLGKDSSGNVYVLVTAQMTASYGTGTMSIEIQENESTKNTKSAPIYISENPVNDAQIESSDEYKSIAEIVEEVNKVSDILIDNEEQINSIYNNIEPIKNVSKNISYIENISSDINDITIVSNNISYVTTTAENIDTIKDASSAADRAAQSATQARQSAQNASQSASNALTYSNQANNYKDEAQSYSNNASSYASQAASSASAAQTSETNAAESARQAAASVASIGDDVATSAANAQSAQQAASSASSSADRAEDAAQRAEQIADFNPADFATAAQGTKADTAVQSVNGKTGTAITLGAADVGAATAAQGTLADTAVQPADLNGYAQTSDIPTELPNPQSLDIRLGSAGGLTAYDGSIARTITITPEAIGAQPAGASSGGELTLLYNNTSVTTFNPGESIIFSAAGYDAIGIVSRHRASDDFYSPMQIVEFNNEPYTTCMLYAVGITSSYGPEISAREVSVAIGAIIAQGRGQYYNWGNHAADDGACIPVQVWGIKF